MDIVAFAKFHRFLDVPDLVVPTKAETEWKYKRRVRYKREKENFWFFTTAISDELFFLTLNEF